MLLPLILNISSDLYAKDGNIKFERISVEQGLSHESVHSITQDKTGFLWFGTYFGLNRYDGKNYQIYKRDPDDRNSLSDSAIWSVFEDSSGILWIGTQNGGFNKFDPEAENFTQYMNDPDDPNSLSHNTVWSIVEDRTGDLWIGTRGGGLNKFNPETEKFTRYMNVPGDTKSLISDMVQRVYEDSSGMIWVGTTGGLNKFDPETENFTRYLNDPDDPESLSHNHVCPIYEDRAGNLWIGTRGGGLNKFDPETEKFTRYLNDPGDPESLSINHVMSIREDSFGMIWIGTRGGGINRFDPETEKFTRYLNDPDDPHSLSQNDAYSIYEDRSGTMWIGTMVGGLDKFDLTMKEFHIFKKNPNDPNSLCNNTVFSIIEDRSGMLWIGTGDGLDRYDPQKGVFTHYRNDPADPNSLGSNYVMAVHEDRSGTLWFGTFNRGLDRFDPETKNFTHYLPNPSDPFSLSHEIVMKVCEDNLGMIWAGTYGGGLNRLDPKTGKFIRFQNNPDDPESLSSNEVMTIYEDSSHALWVGTMGGLDRLYPKTGKFKRFHHDIDDPGSLSHNAVSSIYEDNSGVLWIGTFGGGLNKYDREHESFTRYTKKDGLPDDIIEAIIEDNDANLWLNTPKGLSKFNPITVTFKNYDQSDGLQDHRFGKGSFKTSSGEIYVSCYKGFNSFYPSEIKDNLYAPPVVLTDFRLFNKTVPLGEGADGRTILKKSFSATRELELSFKDDNIYFEFAALHFSSPEKNEYAYIMEGFEDEWNHVGNRNFATYTNLPPGRFVFRVKASNHDGIWNEEGASLKITVTPPFWQTWWFFTLTGVAILFMVFAVHRIRTERIRQKNLELEEHNLQLSEQIRERKMAEKLLQASEERFKTLTANIPGITYRCACDSDWTMEYISKGIEDISGYPASDFINNKIRTYESIIHRDDTQRAEDAVYDGVNHKRPYTIDYRIIRNDGQVCHVHERGQGVFDDNGDVKWLDGVILDVSDRKQAEEQLRKEKDFSHSLIQTTPAFFVTISPVGEVLMMNQAMLTELGYTSEEVIGEDYLTRFVPKSDREALSEVFKTLTNRYEPTVNENLVLKKDGKEIMVEWHGIPILKEDGEIDYFFGVGIDITERRKAEEELVRHRDHLEELVQERTRELAFTKFAFDNAPDAIEWLRSDSAAMVYVNKHVGELLGYSQEEMLNLSVFDFHPVYSQDVWPGFRKELRRQGHMTFESIWQRKDGVQFPVEISARSLTYEGEEFFIAFIRDIRQQKQAQNELKRAKEDAELANERLKELDRLKSMFIASMSHELRTPLNSILGFTGMTLNELSGELNDEQKDNLSRVYNSGKHLLNLITDVIDISKIEAGRTDKFPEDVSLSEIIDEAVGTVQTQFQEKGLNLEIEVPRKITLYTDRKRILQCLLNFLSNSVKYTEEGTVTIKGYESDYSVEISVSDTGIGIAKEDMSRLFEAFERLESHLMVEAGGTGLGLYLTRKIATEILGGEIEVDSEAEKGSTFTLKIPKDYEKLRKE